MPRAIQLVFRTLRVVEETILAGGILIVAALTIVNVFSRTVLNESVAFAEELAQFVMIFVTFVGTSYAASRGRHIRMSAFYDQLGDRGRKVLMIVIATVTSALLFVLAAYSLQYVMTVQERGTVSPALRTPLWVVYLSVPLGLFLSGVQYALAVVRNLVEDEVYLSYEHRDEYEEEETGASPL